MYPGRLSIALLIAVTVLVAVSGGAAPGTDREVVVARIGAISVGAPQSHGGLTIYPLTSRHTQGPDYLTLDQAMRQNAVEIVETESGQVGQVIIRNHSKRPVFIMDGEEIIGAKQNRILNSSVLIPALRTAKLPVSCVEQGRWYGPTAKFSSGGTQLFGTARQAKVADVNANYAADAKAGARSDQSRVWAQVGEKRAALSVGDRSGPMHEAYTKHAARIGDYVKQFHAVRGQVGALFVIRGEIIGADIFGQNETLTQLFSKMIKSYALDAMASPRARPAGPSRGVPTIVDARRFISLALENGVSFKGYPSPGDGSDVRICSPNINGSALVVDRDAIHIALFAPEGPRDTSVKEGNLRPPSQRR